MKGDKRGGVMGGKFTRKNPLFRSVLLGLFCVALLLQFSCASSKKRAKGPGDVAGLGDLSTRNQIQEFKVKEIETSTLIEIEGTQEPDFTVFKLNDPLRVVIDLANTDLGGISGPFSISNGTISEINTTQFDDATSSISRIIIGFDQIVDYEVVPEGPRLKVNIQRIGEIPADPKNIAVKGKFQDKGGAEEVVIPDIGSDFGIEAEEAPSGDLAPATQIVKIDLDKRKDGLKIVFLANGRIQDYNAFQINDPKRLVIDFPGLTSGLAKRTIKTPKPIKAIRIGSHSDKIRMVIDSRDPKSLPEFTTEIAGDRLVLNLGQVGEIPLELDEEVPLAKMDQIEELEPTVEPAAQPSSKKGLEKIGGLDFMQLPSYSRIAVKIPDQIRYDIQPYRDGKVIVNFQGVRLPTTLRRALDTSEFDSPISLISAYEPKEKGGLVRLEVSLREEVPIEEQREPGVVYLDFERTRVFVPTVSQQVSPKNPAEIAQAPEMEQPSVAEPPGVEEPLAALEEPAQPVAPEEEEEAFLPESLPAEPAPQQRVQGNNLFNETLIGGAGLEGPVLGQRQDGLYQDFLASVPEASLSGQTGIRRFTGRRISLDFKDAEIQNIFRLIAEVSKLNIVVAESVKGNITIRLINTPWDQALAIILQSKKLGVVRYDNILRIAPLSELEAERKQALSAKEAERNLEDLKVLVLPINYTTAGDIRAKVQSLLTKRGKITIDERTNTLIIEDIQEVLIKARSLVKTLDTQTPQVLIDSRIVSANRNWQRSLGIQWGGHYVMSPSTGNPTGLSFPSNIGIAGGSGADGSSNEPTPIFPFPGAGVPTDNFVVNLPSTGENGSLGINLGTITGIGDLDVRLSALENQSKLRIISSPRVTTLDNIEASVRQGAQIPFATFSSAGTQTTFVNATLELAVTPHVTNDRRILMEVKVTNNSVGSLQPAGPQIDIAEAETNVLVKDGDTMVLGGIYVLEDNFASDGIPWFRTMPVLKVLFSNYNKVNNRRELLFFITPRVVTQALAAR